MKLPGVAVDEIPLRQVRGDFEGHVVPVRLEEVDLCRDSCSPGIAWSGLHKKMCPTCLQGNDVRAPEVGASCEDAVELPAFVEHVGDSRGTGNRGQGAVMAKEQELTTGRRADGNLESGNRAPRLRILASAFLASAHCIDSGSLPSS